MLTNTSGLQAQEMHEALRAVHAQAEPEDGAEAEHERFARVAASVLTEPGDSRFGELAQELGYNRLLESLISVDSAEAWCASIGQTPRPELVAGWARWQPRLRSADVFAACRHAALLGAEVLWPEHPDWPEGLSDLGPFAPHVLWRRGLAGLDWSGAVALVGARAATGYGEHVAVSFAADLAQHGCLVVSGGAYGIDGMAHRGALAEERPTAAFLAGGVDRLYPSGHRELLERVSRCGALLAELPCGVSPSKWRFLARNRLIAAASRATVVVEAGARSGSLNTAAHAASIGRPLGAVPGPITSPNSAGCHYLLREGAAECVSSSDQALELVTGVLSSVPLEPMRDPELNRALDALGRQPVAAEEVARRAGLSEADARGLLAELELAGLVLHGPRGWTRAAAR